jgi:N-acetyl-anhydromuramyl-L-alanine amidase AmpD
MNIDSSHRSPHFNARPAGMAVVLAVLHADGDAAISNSISWCCDPKADPPVAYHYIIGRTGDIYQLVDPTERAWHAGVSSWQGRTDGEDSVNGFSIGICMGNKQDGIEPFTEAQQAAAAALILDLDKVYGTLAITTHALVAPGRKVDPSPGGPFDLRVFMARLS